MQKWPSISSIFFRVSETPTGIAPRPFPFSCSSTRSHIIHVAITTNIIPTRTKTSQWRLGIPQPAISTFYPRAIHTSTPICNPPKSPKKVIAGIGMTRNFLARAINFQFRPIIGGGGVLRLSLPRQPQARGFQKYHKGPQK